MIEESTDVDVCVRYSSNMDDGHPTQLVEGLGEGLRVSNVLLESILLRMWT